MPSLNSDITSPRWLALKGLLFVAAAVGSAVAIGALAAARGEWPLIVGIHLLGAWCACRAYYCAFYVLEKYAGGGPYAGVVAAARAALTMIRRNRARAES